MTPKEKADEIFKKYYDDIDVCEKHWDERPSLCEHHAKQCAIICVEQIIGSLEVFAYTGTFYDHFETGKMVTTEQASPTEYYRSVLEHIKNS